MLDIKKLKIHTNMEVVGGKIYNKNLMLLILIVIFSFVALLGCEEKDKNEEEVKLGPGKRLLTEKKVVNELEEQLDLKEANNLEIPIDKDIDINPNTYTLGNGDGNLFIYVFESIEDRYEVFPADLGGSVSVQDNEEHNYMLYNAKNATIVFEPETNDPIRVFSKIGDVAYKQLNDINKKEFKGEGEYWEIKLSVSYFNYNLENIDQQTGYGTFTCNLDYKGEEIEKVNSITLWYPYEVEHSGASQRGIVKEKLNSDGTLDLSLNENIDNFPIDLKEEEIQVFLEWNENDDEEVEIIMLERQ